MKKIQLGFMRNLTPQHQENLYKLLDMKYNLLFGKEKIWRALHAMDADLEPGSIYLEKYKRKPDDFRKFGDFADGEQTLVWRLRNEKTASDAAEILNKLFHGSGVKFIFEKSGEGAISVPIIRTNMDKLQWSKLAILCKYRFDREFPKKEERERLHKICKEGMEVYLDTVNTGKKWDATEGMPASISIPGMHGLLRPANGLKPDRGRKIRELNDPQISGVPFMFRGIPIHVDMNKYGTLETTPYFMGHDPFRATLAKIMGDEHNGHTLVELILEHVNEATGIDVVSKHLSPTARGLHGGVFMSAVQALAEGRLEPLNLLFYAAGGALVGFIGEQWVHFGSHDELKAHPQMLTDVLVNKGIDPISIKVAKNSAASEVAELKAKAFSSENLSELEALLLKRNAFEIIVDGAPQRIADEVPANRLDNVFSTQVAASVGALRGGL